MWIIYSPIVALTANAVLALTAFFFVTNGAELIDQLYITDDDAIDAHFGDKDNDDKSVGGRSGNLRNDHGMGLLKRQIDVERNSFAGSRNSAADSEIEAEMRDGTPGSMPPMAPKRQKPLNQIKDVSSPEVSVSSSERLSKRHKY